MEIYDLLRDNKEKKYCFLDFETCNLCLNECHNLPWQLSMISVKGSERREFNYYIKWPGGMKVSQGAAIITRFNPGIIEERGMHPEFVLDELDRELNTADIIGGHNLLGFDTYMAQSFYRKCGRKPYNIVPKVLDTFPIAKAIKLSIPFNKETDDFAAWQYRLYHKIQRGLKCSLGALGKEYGIEHDYENLHDAINDLNLNIKLWDKLKWQINL